MRADTLIQSNILKDSQDDYGRKQWAILESIEQRYASVDTSSFLHQENTSIFDDKWYLINATTALDFSKYLPQVEHKPLRLILQVVAYELIHTHKQATNTVITGMISFISYFCSFLIERRVFVAPYNAPFLSMSVLESNDITNQVQLMMAKRGTINKSALFVIQRIANFSDPDVSALLGQFPRPWVEENIELGEWINQQLAIAGIEKSDGFYPPLPFETVSTIVKHCVPVLDASNTLTNLVNIARENETGNEGDPYGLDRMNSVVADYILEHRKSFESIRPLEFTTRVHTHAEREYSYKKVAKGYFLRTLYLAQSACIWIVMLTTGLRNCDLRNLRVGCCQPSKNHQGVWWLVADIQKTKNRLALPVGETTYRAVKLLEQLRLNDNGFLITPLCRKAKTISASGRKFSEEEVGKYKCGESINKMLMELPSRYGFELKTILDDDATAHCIRATLAGYIAENSYTAILLLKRLFGHSNALMPDQYIRRNPLVIKKREEMLQQSQESIAKDLAKAIVNGEVSGRYCEMLDKGSEALKEDIKLENKSLTEMEMLQTMEERLYQVLIEDIQDGQTYAIATPMSVVCMRATNDGTDSPCNAHLNHAKRKETKIAKSLTDALMTLPNPSQCVGISCPTALMGKKWSRKLLETFDFYIRYRQGINANFDMDEEATAFVKMYAEPLKKIYSDERAGGYFDVN